MAELEREIADDAAAALGLTVNTDCFYGHFPDTDENPCVCFIQTGGPPEREDRAWSDYTVQVMVKGSYTLARDLAEDIYNRWHGSSNWSLANWYVHYATALQPPFALGRQEKNREAFSFNLLVSVRET